MRTLSLSLLGPFAASLGNERLLHFRTRSVQALLVRLVVEADTGAPLRRDDLAELLWPGMPPGSGRKNLRQALYELRQLIPEVAARNGVGSVPFILAERDIIEVNPESDYFLDVSAFSRLLAQGDAESLAEAVDLYRGDFLDDFYLPDSELFEEWAARRRAQFRREVLRALETLSERHLQEADYYQAEVYARQQLEIDDLRETAVRQLMATLAGRGERPAALAAYEAHRERLLEEMDVEPTAETAALYQRIKEGGEGIPRKETEAPTAVAPPEPDEAAHNLPAQATAFIGRGAELAAIERRVRDDPACRLLTLLGPGGSGKTRLAIEAGARLAGGGHATFANGVWFVPLAPLSEHESIIPAIAGATGLSFYAETEPRQQLLDYLREKEMLLILDNFEHLLGEESAAFLATVLAAAPQVKLMVTSRERLNVRGEHVFPVEGLDTPQIGEDDGAVDLEIAAYSGVNLFLQSARRVRPDFKLTSENAPAVARICQLVQGLPLGLELAATWTELLEPAEIADEVARSLDFLEAEWYGLPERQRSVRAVFETSWKLLSEDERQVLKGLSSFHGGFSREAAQAVTNASLKKLRALSGKSWLVREAGDRYQIHPLLCQYAAEKLWAEPAAGQRVREAHTDYYAGLLPKLAEAMKGPEQNETFDLMAVEFENARAAWRHLVRTGRVEDAVEQLLPGLFLFCGARGRGADLLSLVQAAQQASADVSDRSQAILTIAEISFWQAVYMIRFFVDLSSFYFPVDRVRWAWKTLDEMGLEEVPAFWLILATVLYGWATGEETEIDRLRALAGELGDRGDRWSQAFALQCLGRLRSQRWPFTVDAAAGGAERAAAVNAQRQEEIWQSLTEAAAGFREIGDHLERAHTLRILGLYLLTYQPDEAASLLADALAVLQAAGDRMVAAHVLWSLGEAHINQGKYEEGFAFIRDMRQVYEQLGKREFIGYAYSMQSMEELRYGDIERARWARQQALAIGRETNDLVDGVAWGHWELGEVERVAGNRAAARRHYEKALPIFEEFENELGIAFYDRGLGDIAHAEGDFAAAHHHFERYLDRARELGHDWSIIYGLCGLGRAAVELANYEAARSHFVEAMKKADLLGYGDLQLAALAGLASLALATGDAEGSVELASLVREHVASWRETREQAAAVIEAARPALPAGTMESALARGSRLDFRGVLDSFMPGRPTERWTSPGRVHGANNIS